MKSIEAIRGFLRYLGLGAVVAIAVLSEVPGTLRPHVLPVTQLEHFVAYFGAALLLALGFWNRKNALLLALALPIYAGVLEIAQLFVPDRDAQFIDFLASSAGTCAGLFSAWLLRLAFRLSSCRSAAGASDLTR